MRGAAAHGVPATASGSTRTGGRTSGPPGDHVAEDEEHMKMVRLLDEIEDLRVDMTRTSGARNLADPLMCSAVLAVKARHSCRGHDFRRSRGVFLLGERITIHPPALYRVVSCGGCLSGPRIIMHGMKPKNDARRLMCFGI